MSQQPTSRRRREAALLALALLLASPLPAAAAESPVDRANRGLVEVVTGSAFGASARMGEDLAAVLDDGATRRVLPVIGKGSLQNLVDLRGLRGADLAIVQTDALDYAKTQRLYPGIESSVTYIAKLYNEEFHLLARGGIKSVGDLAGKKVSIGLPGDGTALTATRLFDLLKLKVQPVAFDPALALDKLRSGEIDAMAYVSAKPAPLFQTLQPRDGLHFVAIPLGKEVASAYLPARLIDDDYPGLVTAQAPVDTVAVGTVLLAANLAPGSERYRNVANFVDAFFTQFPKLLESARHPKWNEVNLAAELPGWRRFGPADSWIKRNGGAPAMVSEEQLHGIFDKFLDERSKSAGQTMTSAQKNELFDQFKRWQATTTQ
jgi:TRAP transporter TAXI family solute receptor